ncbi:hypothetical protein BBta_0583 [Bradyrhizobium sp. BTAi1]|nr:hypothetical protein BBta_0583 [Bradyrhizobium sp. BTAi1]
MSTIAPHTEADPVAILIQVLVMFGNVVGRLPHYQVEADQHHLNLFCVLVGQSAKGRKGTSGSRARSIMQMADEVWLNERMKGGLSSGEGLIAEVRDEVEQWDPKAQELRVVDPGVADKRLMVSEAEFSSALAVMERPGNTLSSIVRKAWDGGKLSTLTRNSPLCATDPHISIIGHITEDELRARINRTEAANGFANRFLFVAVRRSKCLPHGGSLDEAETLILAERMKEAVAFAKRVGRVEMTDSARQLWESVYAHLSAEQPGLLGAVTARAEAQTIRLALAYALLDRHDAIDAQHLKAALAVWEYCDASAARVFGRLLGDPVADEILAALRHAGGVGLTRTLIRDVLGKHKTADRINAALALLAGKGLVRWSSASTGGRPAETWYINGA